jgi:hypothetical protein
MLFMALVYDRAEVRSICLFVHLRFTSAAIMSLRGRERAMRKIGTACLVAGTLLIGLSGASPSHVKTHGIALSGTVSSVSAAAKTFVVRDSGGKDTSLVWTDATKVTGGALTTGQNVTLRYLVKDKKNIATSVKIAAPLPQQTPASPTAPAAAATPRTRSA